MWMHSPAPLQCQGFNIFCLPASLEDWPRADRGTFPCGPSSLSVFLWQQRAKAESVNRQLQKQLLDYNVPSVMSYVQKNMSVTDLEKSIKTWQRKVAVAEVRPGWVCGTQLSAGSWWSCICATLGTAALAPDLPGSLASVPPRHRGLAEPGALPVYGAVIAPYPEDGG